MLKHDEVDLYPIPGESFRTLVDLSDIYKAGQLSKRFLGRPSTTDGGIRRASGAAGVWTHQTFLVSVCTLIS